MSESVELRPWLDGSIPAGRGPGSLLAAGRADVEVGFIEMVDDSKARAYYPADSSNEIVAPVMEGRYFAGAICPALLGSDGRVAAIYPPLAWPEGGDPTLVGAAEADRIKVELLQAEKNERFEMVKEAFEEFVPEVNTGLQDALDAASQAGDAANQAQNDAQDAYDAAMAAIVGSVVEFAVGMSETQAPTLGWSEVQPVRIAGSFIWMRTVIRYANGSTQTTSAALLTGNTGSDGAAGKDGVGLVTTVVAYALSTSGTSAPSSGWSATPPALIAGRFMWTRTVWSYSDSTSETGYSVAYAARDGSDGDDGLPGKDGVGIVATTITYAMSTSGTVAPSSGWQAQPPASVPGRFMWTRTVWSYSDSTSETGYSVGKIGEVGPKGDDGQGIEIAGTVSTYAGLPSGLTASDAGKAYLVEADGLLYIWDGLRFPTNGAGVQFRGPAGTPGSDGADGRSITSVDVEYYLSTSSTAQIGGSWVTTAPAWVDGRFMWSRTRTKYSTGSDSLSAPACITGAKGAPGTNGNPGSDGVGVASIVEQYYLSTSSSTQAGGSWGTSVPTYVVGRYYWTRSVITYTNSTTTTTTPVCVSGAPGTPGNDGANGIGVTSILSYYLRATAKPAKPTVASPSGWSTTEPAYVAGEKLFRADKVTYTNGAFAWSDVSEVSAYTAASLAMTTADGKSTVTYGTARPSSPKAGDRFYNSANGKAEVYSGSAWRDTTPGEGFVPALDIGSGTAGDFSVGRLTVVGGATFPTAVVETMLGQDAFFQRMAANQFVSTPGNLLMDPSFKQKLAWSNSAYVQEAGGRFGGGSLLVPASTSQVGVYTGATASTMVYNPRVVAGIRYKLSVYFNSALASTTGDKVRIYYRWYKEDGTNSWSTYTAATASVFSANSWTLLEGETVECPVGATRLAFGLYVESAHNAQVRFSDPAMLAMVGDILLQDGSVVADKFAAKIVLTSEVIAGDETKYHTKLSQTGLQFFSKLKDIAAPVPVLAINTPGTDKEDSVFELLDPNDLTSSTATINVAGQASFDSLSVPNLTELEDVAVRGRTLEALIEAASPRLVLDQRLLGSEFGTWTEGGSNVASLAAVSIANPYDYPVTVLIQQTVVPIYANGNVVMRAYWNYSVGEAPAMPSASLANAKVRGSVRTGTAGDDQIVVPPLPVTIPAGQAMKARLMCYGSSGSGSVTWTIPSAEELVIQAITMGALDPEWDAILSYVTKSPTVEVTPGTAKKTYVMTVKSSWLRAFYRDSGAYNSYYAGKAVHGSYSNSAATAFKGAIGFADFTAALAGSTVTKVRARIQLAHTYQGSGAKIGVGLHTALNAPASMSGGSALATTGVITAGGAGWVTLPMDAAQRERLRTGGLRGLLLYPPSNSTSVYGYASIAPNQYLEITYVK